MSINFGLLNDVGWQSYAMRYHTSTRETPWTDEEFDAGRARYGNRSWAEANREQYAEDFLNWRKESFRRALERSMNDNQFAFITRDFNPSNLIGGRREFTHQSNVFQALANTFENKIRGLEALGNDFGGRFISDEDMEIRLAVIHELFDQAFRSVADIVREFAPNFVANDVLIVGELIKNHIRSGESADTVADMLRNNNQTIMDFDEIIALSLRISPTR